jgi:hypothetical protein
VSPPDEEKREVSGVTAGVGRCASSFSVQLLPPVSFRL